MLSWFNLADGNSALASHLFTPALPAQRDGEDNGQKRKLVSVDKDSLIREQRK